jgi:hypothetical protein
VWQLPRRYQEWKKFKDLIRDMIQGQPGFADVKSTTGMIGLKDGPDAIAAFGEEPCVTPASSD